MELLSLIPSFGNLLFTLGAFVLALLVIVSIHEYGHYIVGRWSGIHAEVFSLGFGPVLWSRPDRHGTIWQIAALPFGGYVKFLGDADASSGKDADAIARLDATDQRRTMHGAPLWARAATVAAGPVFNFVLSIVIFGAVIGFRGVAFDPMTVADLRPVPGENGLQIGDEILAIAGTPIAKIDAFNAYVDTLPLEAVLDYSVHRNDETLTVYAPYIYPPLVMALTPGSAAMDADIKVGDVVLSVDGQAVFAFSQLREMVGVSDGATLALEIWRDGNVLTKMLTPRRVDLPLQDGSFETRWLIGITGGMLIERETTTPGLFKSIGYGAEQTYFIVKSSISGLYHVIVGSISSCNLRGPVGIAQTSGQAASQGLLSFIWFVAVLSTAVGFLNLFPIPILDGGHLVFHAYEAVTGRAPSDKTLRALMAIGLALILSLMVFALSNDFMCP